MTVPMSHPVADPAQGSTAEATASAGARLSGPLLLGWAVTAVLLVYLVLIGGGWSGIYVAVLRVTTLIFAALGLLVWTVLVVRGRLRSCQARSGRRSPPPSAPWPSPRWPPERRG